MIDTAEISKHKSMSNEEFVELAKEIDRQPFISVVEVQGNGWAIYGPFGVYESSNKERVFNDLCHIHGLLKDWGFKGFVRGGYVNLFDLPA